MIRKLLPLLLFSMSIYADELSSSNINQVFLKTELPTRTLQKMTIKYQLNSNSFKEDDYGGSTAYSIFPIENWIGLTPEYQYSNYHQYVEVTRGYALINVDAKQSLNEDVAKWAADQQKAILGCKNYSNADCKVYAIHGGSSSNKEPKKLNFAFIGTITVEVYPTAGEGINRGKIYTCKNIILGQGFNGIQHNWWMYTNYWPTNSSGKPKKNADKNSILCSTSSGGTDILSISSAGTHTFYVTGYDRY